MDADKNKLITKAIDLIKADRWRVSNDRATRLVQSGNLRSVGLNYRHIRRYLTYIFHIRPESTPTTSDFVSSCYKPNVCHSRTGPPEV